MREREREREREKVLPGGHFASADGYFFQQRIGKTNPPFYPVRGSIYLPVINTCCFEQANTSACMKRVLIRVKFGPKPDDDDDACGERERERIEERNRLLGVGFG
jgi:hypothetical protein